MDMFDLILKPICYLCMILIILNKNTKNNCIIIVIVVNIVAHKIKTFVKTIIMRGSD